MTCRVGLARDSRHHVRADLPPCERRAPRVIREVVQSRSNIQAPLCAFPLQKIVVVAFTSPSRLAVVFCRLQLPFAIRVCITRFGDRDVIVTHQTCGTGWTGIGRTMPSTRACTRERGSWIALSSSVRQSEKRNENRFEKQMRHYQVHKRVSY